MFNKKVEVLDKFGRTLAIFTNEDENVDGESNDKLIDPIVTLNQNSDNILSFSISENSKKWEQIKSIENLYSVDGHIYSPLFSDSYTHTITEDNQNIVQVKAYERQKMLEKVYVTAWNSTTGFENIDTFMVVILSKGDLPLTNNGENVNPGEYSLGSAGYILKGLLHGTGWNVGIVDVEGTYDFETEQLSVYENILKVQELYGGILIFDSVRKIVHLRDESNYVSYTGYEIRREKNLKNLNLEINNAIVTKLYVFGEAGLNIASVNDGKIYLENYTYSNEVYEGIITNTDIYEPEQLMSWGRRNLLELCGPRKTLITNIAYLNQKEEFKNETIRLNDSVDVYIANFIDEKLRVLGLEYKVFDPSSAMVTLGDTTKNTNDIFKKISNTTNAYNSGKIDAELLKDYNTGNTVAQEFEIQRKQNITFQTNFEGLNLNIENVANKVDNEGNRISTVESSINDINITTDGIEQNLQKQGGSNLLYNSSAYFNEEHWRGAVKSYTDSYIKNNFLSKNCFLLMNNTIGQNIAVPNGEYYVGFKYKKLIDLANCTFNVNEEIIDLTNIELTDVERTIIVTDHNIKIEMTSDTANSCYVGDIIVVPGYKQKWSPNSNEIFTDTVKIGLGIEISSNSANTKFRADVDGTRIINRVTGEVTSEFTDTGTVTKSLKANSAQVGGLLIQQVNNQTWLNSVL